MNLFRTANRWGGLLLDTAFPPKCASCGGIVDGAPLPHVCDRCFAKIHIIEDPRCLTCGYPFFGDTDSHEDCQHCSRLTPKFRRGWSVALFRGPVRDLLYALKYANGLWALDDIGRIVEYAEGLSDFLEDAVLVPVPLHRRKERERGYNQCALIAESIARRFSCLGVEKALDRRVDTPSQTQFDRRERYRNLRNAFVSSSPGTIDARFHYVIVDDVFTTGSTLNACAAALRQVGAKNVDVLTIGHG